MHKILTGKAKEDFENYVLNKELGHDSEVLISVYNQESLFINYNNVKETLLNALIIEWFDSVGIYIEISFYDDCYWTYNIYSNKPVLEKEIANICNNRQEALTEAIKKANEIYNNKN